MSKLQSYQKVIGGLLSHAISILSVSHMESPLTSVTNKNSSVSEKQSVETNLGYGQPPLSIDEALQYFASDNEDDIEI